jgi:hypothetical protein
MAKPASSTAIPPKPTTRKAKPKTATPKRTALASAPSLLKEGVNDDGKSFVALLEARKASKAVDLALSLVEHFAFVSLVKGGRIYLRSWAPEEKKSRPTLMVRFLDKSKAKSSDGLCNIQANGKLNITMAPIKARAPKAAKSLVAIGVHPDADQRGYEATTKLVAALTAAAMEWSADERLRP